MGKKTYKGKFRYIDIEIPNNGLNKIFIQKRWLLWWKNFDIILYKKGFIVDIDKQHNKLMGELKLAAQCPT